MLGHIGGGRHWRNASVACALLLVAAGCTSDPGGPAEDDAPTLGAVEAAWRSAEECLRGAGFDATAALADGDWGISFEGDLEESQQFDSTYDGCVGAAEELTLAFQRSQIPEGAERLELARSFDACITGIGLEKFTYDPNSANASDLLAEATIQLGFALEDLAVADDPRFTQVLGCFQSHELLFPGRFESNP